nr:accessory Sec system glycosylation chaperone GtfB [Mammaliicoccus sp. Marseille-Q6498]
MINLFETFDENTKKLYNTLENVGVDNQTIIIEEDGFLPEHVLSPYQFFSGHIDKMSKPLFFNEVEIPQFWEIEGDNHSAVVKNMGETKARIFYKKDHGFRIVARVEWLHKNGQIQFIDYYNQYGVKYAQLVFDEHQKRILKRWFNAENKEIIYENFITNDIILYWCGKEYIFQSKVQFVVFFLKEANIPLDSFLINRLSIPYAVLHELQIPGHDYLFWQEKTNGQLPGNMTVMLSNKHRNSRVIVPSEQEYQKIIELVEESKEYKIIKSGYVYDLVDCQHEKNNILILTNSDQIPHLEDLIITLPNYQFHIVSVTEMSHILMGLNDFRNVNLYPKAMRHTISLLYNKCDIYLDINKGNEILDAVKTAFEHQMLILGYEETLHNEAYVARNNQFLLNDGEKLYKVLKQIENDEAVKTQKLEFQKKHAGVISEMEFKEFFNR